MALPHGNCEGRANMAGAVVPMVASRAKIAIEEFLNFQESSKC
jgi:hypothetical protein